MFRNLQYLNMSDSIDNKMIQCINNRIATVVAQRNGEMTPYDPGDPPLDSLETIDFDPSSPIAPLLCVKLQSFMKRIIRQMSARKQVQTGALVNKGKNPKDPRHVVPRKVVYETTIFTSRNLYDMLKDDRQLIPRQPIYNLFIGRLLTHFSQKRSLKVKRALKNKEDDDDDKGNKLK